MFVLMGTLLLSGCNAKTEENPQQSTEASDTVSTSVTEIDTSDMFSDRDKEVGYEETESVAISLADGGSACESDAVSIAENTVTIKEEGTYVITSADHGISGKDSVRIANGSYTIVSGKDGIQAENTEDSSLGFVYLAGGTFDIFSQQDGISAGSWSQAEDETYTILTREGSSSVQSQSNGEGHPMEQMQQESTEKDTTSIKGIKAGTQLVLNDGTYDIDGGDDALHSNGNLAVNGGTYTLSSGDDGIHADANTTISGGSIDIIRSYEGIEGLSIDITGGEIAVHASDDGMNAAGGNDSSGFEGPGPGGDQFAATEGAYIHIGGGKLEVDAVGDGIDSNGDITVSGGETYTVKAGTTEQSITMDSLVYGSNAEERGSRKGGSL